MPHAFPVNLSVLLETIIMLNLINQLEKRLNKRLYQ